jgi:hypothetical protein
MVMISDNNRLARAIRVTAERIRVAPATVGRDERRGEFRCNRSARDMGRCTMSRGTSSRVQGTRPGCPIIMFWDRSLLAVDVMLRATRDPAFDSR